MHNTYLHLLRRPHVEIDTLHCGVSSALCQQHEVRHDLQRERPTRAVRSSTPTFANMRAHRAVDARAPNTQVYAAVCQPPVLLRVCALGLVFGARRAWPMSTGPQNTGAGWIPIPPSRGPASDAQTRLRAIEIGANRLPTSSTPTDSTRPSAHLCVSLDSGAKAPVRRSSHAGPASSRSKAKTAQADSYVGYEHC